MLASDTLSHFNPRSRKGSDVAGDMEEVQSNIISIHAPARGATPFCICQTLLPEFQSTLPQGERRLHPRLLLQV